MADDNQTPRKKLLVTGSTFPRWEGDTEPRFVLDMSASLAKLYDVTVLVPAAPGAADTEVMDGVKVVRYHYFPIHKWETLCYPGAIVPRIKEKKVRAFLVPCLMLALWHNVRKYEKNMDFVQAHWIIPQGIVQSYCKKPYMVTCHGSDVTSLNKGFMLKLKKRCLEKASYVTFVSKFLSDYSERITHIDNKSILSMGVRGCEFGPQYRVENFFGQNGKKVVLFVGRLAEIKGVNFLIEAMKGIDAKLVIAGDGPIKADLEAQAREAGIDALFLGSKTHDELRTIFASADVFAAPSVKNKEGGMEGLGLVNLEAMSSGLPVIASKYGGIIEVIRDHDNGLLIAGDSVEEIHKALLEVVSDDALAEKLRTNGLETAKKYDYDYLAREYGKCLESML